MLLFSVHWQWTTRNGKSATWYAAWCSGSITAATSRSNWISTRRRERLFRIWIRCTCSSSSVSTGRPSTRGKSFEGITRGERRHSWELARHSASSRFRRWPSCRRGFSCTCYPDKSRFLISASDKVGRGRWKKLLTVDCFMMTIFCWLSFCWLFCVDFSLLTVDFSLLTFVCWLLIVDCWLLTVDYWPLTIDRWLLTVGYWLLTVDF